MNLFLPLYSLIAYLAPSSVLYSTIAIPVEYPRSSHKIPNFVISPQASNSSYLYLLLCKYENKNKLLHAILNGQWNDIDFQFSIFFRFSFKIIVIIAGFIFIKVFLIGLPFRLILLILIITKSIVILCNIFR